MQPLICEANGKSPQLGSNNKIAPNATIVGDVISGRDCTFWFGAVVRGDVNTIQLGDRVNVQDNATIHCTYQKTTTIVGDDVTIGHGACVHGCTIGSRVLVGINAVVLDDAIVEDDVLVAAGAVVLQGAHLKSGGIYAGVPAKRIKELDIKHTEGTISRISHAYPKYAAWFDGVFKATDS